MKVSRCLLNLSLAIMMAGGCIMNSAWAAEADTTNAATPSATRDTTTVKTTPSAAQDTTKQPSLIQEEYEILRDKAQKQADDLKDELKYGIQEGWEEAKTTYKNQGVDTWNRLKEKSKEVKDEAVKLFDTHIKSQVVGKFSDNRRQCNQDFCQHLLSGFSAYKMQFNTPDFPQLPKPKNGPDTTFAPITYIEPADVHTLSKPATPRPPAKFTDELLQSNQIKVQSDGMVVTLDFEPRINSYGIGANTEKNLAAFWQKLSESRFDIPLRQLYEAARRHQLGDWGFYRLTSAAAAALYPKNKNGEQALWTVFMLNQAGYAAKIGRMGADKKTYRLIVLLPFYEKIYGYPYVEIGGAPFYFMEKISGKQRTESIYTHKGCFALGTTAMSLQCKNPLTLPSLYEKNGRFSYNLRMIEFYKNHPCAGTALYLHAPCETVLGKSIYYRLQPMADSLLGSGADTAVENAILYFGNFVSSYFEENAKKKVKPEGHPLFPEEAFAFKAGDQKDRAIMMARLVKQFVGLPVVLAEYEKTALVGIALPHPPKQAAGQALAAIQSDGLTFYLFNPNVKSSQFWHCPANLRGAQPIVVP